MKVKSIVMEANGPEDELLTEFIRKTNNETSLLKLESFTVEDNTVYAKFLFEGFDPENIESLKSLETERGCLIVVIANQVYIIDTFTLEEFGNLYNMPPINQIIELKSPGFVLAANQDMRMMEEDLSSATTHCLEGFF